MPSEADGLLAAIAAARGGQDEALRRWEQEARPLVVGALERAGIDPASIDEAILHLLEEAHIAVCSDRWIDCEPAWMSAVLARGWFRSRRRDAEDQRARLIAAALAHAAERQEFGRQAEQREAISVAATRLPRRFRVVIAHHLRGLDTRDVRALLCAEFAVGPEQARRIEESAFARMRTALGESERGR